MSTADYQKLPGTYVMPWTRQRLYLGPDHILQVTLTLFNEQYRRFYLRDIEAIVLAEKGSAGLYLLGGGLLLSLLSLVLFYSGRPAGGSFTLFPGLVLLVAGVRMANCACYLRTASAVERLPSLGRIDAARRALAILTPAIQAAQTPKAEDAL